MALARKPIEIVKEGKHQLLVKAAHWERIYLKEVAKVQNGFAFSSNFFTKSKGLPLIRIRDIDEETTVDNYSGAYNKDFIVKKGDILIGMDGDFKAAKWKGKDALLNQRVCRIILNSKNYSDKFLFSCLQPFLDAIHAETSSVTVKHISSKTIEDIPLPYPSLSEQHAIVSKIEELLSELDKGKQQLETAQQQLKIYRQAVLKWAFEGKDFLPFENFLKSSQNGLSKRSGIKGTKYKVLRLADVTDNAIDDSNPRMIFMDEDEILKYKIHEDDLVCVRVNGSKDLVGKLIHVSSKNENDNWAFCDHFIRFTLLPARATAKFFHYYFSTVEVRKYIHDNMVTSAGQNTVSQGTIKGVPVPNFPVSEQQLIVQKIEGRLSACDKVEETITINLQQAETLRQSILKKAFEGKLI